MELGSILRKFERSGIAKYKYKGGNPQRENVAGVATREGLYTNGCVPYIIFNEADPEH